MPPTPQQTAAGYHALWSRAVTDPSRRAPARAVANKILAQRDTYASIERATGVPMVLTGPLHARESSLRFDRHLHNGDPLTARTVQVPKGRPKQGAPPFTFMDSTVDALTMPPHALDKVKTWSVERMLYEAEKYNGWGYLGKGNSPYLWAGTSEYTGGKYVADHVYDPRVVDRQLGCVPIMKALAEIDPAIAAQLAHSEATPPRDVKANETRAARTARSGGVVAAGGGIAGEAGNQLTTSSATQMPQGADQLMPGWMTVGLISAGLAIALIATILIRRRLAFITEKWSGA